MGTLHAGAALRTGSFSAGRHSHTQRCTQLRDAGASPAPSGQQTGGAPSAAPTTSKKRSKDRDTADCTTNGSSLVACREGKPAVLSSFHVPGASSQLFELPLKHEQAAKCHQILEACFTVKGRGREVHLEAFELIRGWRTSGRGSRSQRKKDAVPIK